jgi:hypothetical protein
MNEEAGLKASELRGERLMKAGPWESKCAASDLKRLDRGRLGCAASDSRRLK